MFSEVLLSSLQYAYITVYSDSDHRRLSLRRIKYRRLRGGWLTSPAVWTWTCMRRGVRRPAPVQTFASTMASSEQGRRVARLVTIVSWACSVPTRLGSGRFHLDMWRAWCLSVGAVPPRVRWSAPVQTYRFNDRTLRTGVWSGRVGNYAIPGASASVSWEPFAFGLPCPSLHLVWCRTLY